MKKFLCGILSVILLALSLSSCSLVCEHKWTEATCTTPKICTLCGKTEGDALLHDFADATCDLPKICTRCGYTVGEALGHEMVGKICFRCGYEAWSVENFGFYDFDKCNKFVPIHKYNLAMKEAYNDNFGKNYDYYEYRILEFYDNYFSGRTLDTDGKDKPYKKAISIINNERLLIIDKNSYLTIYDRIVINDDENTFILKVMGDDNFEEWYVSYDAIDWSKSPEKITDGDEKGLKFYLK